MFTIELFSLLICLQSETPKRQQRKACGSDLRLYVCRICSSYTMGCPPVRGDNPRALASGLSYVQVDKHGIPILYHLHHC